MFLRHHQIASGEPLDGWTKGSKRMTLDTAVEASEIVDALKPFGIKQGERGGGSPCFRPGSARLAVREHYQ